MFFGYFKGLPYERATEDFEQYKSYKNTISKEKVIQRMKNLNPGLTSLPSYDIFTGAKLHAGMFIDGQFRFPYEFLHYYENYDIGIPYEYEMYLETVMN